MSARRHARSPFRLLVGLVLATALGCGGGDTSESTGVVQTTPTPKPGALSIVATNAGLGDGAILIRIAGGGVDSATAVGDRVWASGSNPTDIIIVGNISSGLTLARIWVPNTLALASYIVTVQQAATRPTYAMQATGAIVIGVQ